tara:strand:- start:4569 stop:4808 length:240 start_codon:yes stop_codon:yes gene_type:complete
MDSGITPRPVADMSLQYFNPKHSTVVDMIMIQLISAILVSIFILGWKGQELNQQDVSLFMVGIMVSFFLLNTVYARITR